MKSIGKKDLLAGEVVIYKPKVHWIVLFRPSLLFGLAFLLWFVKWNVRLSGARGVFLAILDPTVKFDLLAIIVAAAFCLVWSMIEYCASDYYITNKRLILKKGLFSVSLIEMPMGKVESVFCRQNLFGQLFKYGTVFVSGVGGKQRSRYDTIRKPYLTRRIINRVLERDKNITVVSGPPKGASAPVGRRSEQDIEYGIFVVNPRPAKA
ncbi:MAG: PH domain-containing protein [Treponema sp.]|jgi:uncharacterized membrane protein YdbT with pleckstrin-like domain|nr:PH domain-containing protein [Treponema sp.]